VWRPPFWVMNTPPTFELGEVFYLELPGITTAKARAMTANGTVLATSLPKDDHCLEIWREFLDAKSLILTLGFGTNGVVKFDEKGQLFTGQEPLWLSKFHLEWAGTMKYAFVDIFFDPSSAIQIEGSRDLKTWVSTWGVFRERLWGDDHGRWGWSVWHALPPPTQKFRFYRARYQ